MATKTEQLQKYKFEFIQFDENHEANFVATYTTKPITKARARELCTSQLKKYSGLLGERFTFRILDSEGDQIYLKGK